MQHRCHVHFMEPPQQQSQCVGFVVMGLEQFDLLIATYFQQFSDQTEIFCPMILDDRQRAVKLRGARSQGRLDDRVGWTQVYDLRMISVLSDEAWGIENRLFRTATGAGNNTQVEHLTRRHSLIPRFL